MTGNRVAGRCWDAWIRRGQLTRSPKKTFGAIRQHQGVWTIKCDGHRHRDCWFALCQGTGTVSVTAESRIGSHLVEREGCGGRLVRDLQLQRVGIGCVYECDAYKAGTKCSRPLKFQKIILCIAVACATVDGHVAACPE